MTLAQIQKLLVGQTVLYTPVGETKAQIASVIQNGPDITPSPPVSATFPPRWLRIRIHDPGTANDWQLDYPITGDISTLSLP